MTTIINKPSASGSTTISMMYAYAQGKITTIGLEIVGLDTTVDDFTTLHSLNGFLIYPQQYANQVFDSSVTDFNTRDVQDINSPSSSTSIPHFDSWLNVYTFSKFFPELELVSPEDSQVPTGRALDHSIASAIGNYLTDSLGSIIKPISDTLSSAYNSAYSSIKDGLKGSFLGSLAPSLPNFFPSPPNAPNDDNSSSESKYWCSSIYIPRKDIMYQYTPPKAKISGSGGKSLEEKSKMAKKGQLKAIAGTPSIRQSLALSFLGASANWGLEVGSTPSPDLVTAVADALQGFADGHAGVIGNSGTPMISDSDRMGYLTSAMNSLNSAVSGLATSSASLPSSIQNILFDTVDGKIDNFSRFFMDIYKNDSNIDYRSSNLLKIAQKSSKNVIIYDNEALGDFSDYIDSK